MLIVCVAKNDGKVRCNSRIGSAMLNRPPVPVAKEKLVDVMQDGAAAGLLYPNLNHRQCVSDHNIQELCKTAQDDRTGAVV